MSTLITSLLGSLPTASAVPAAVPGQLWPIYSKGAPTPPTFAGPPDLEANWHKAMEYGRKMESSVNDAMFACQKEKSDLQRSIQHYVDLIRTSTDAELTHLPRALKLAADVLNYISKIQGFMTKIQALTQAIQTNLNSLQSLEAAAMAMIQNNLNALANFMQDICNLGLPPLPSMPSYFGANVFTFNGFDFASLPAMLSATTSG